MRLRAIVWKERTNRSPQVDIIILFFLLGGGLFMALPIIYSFVQAIKPMNELFIFPPKFFVSNPTLNNVQDLFILMGQSWVPMTRYLFNSFFIVGVGIVGNLFICSLAAYGLAIFEFPGKKLYTTLIVLSLMFAAPATAIPNFYILSKLNLINTYWALILPSWAYTLGLYLLVNFMSSMVPKALLDSARIDGASEFRVYSQIVMPIIKPAWLTLMILVFQQLWGNTGEQFIYAEQLKPLQYALTQIIAGGIARAGASAVVVFFLILVPIIVFVFNQSKIVETMGSSGIKE